MARVRDADDLFVRELRVALGAEHSVEAALGELIERVADAQLRAGLERHRGETHEHVLSLESSLRIVAGDAEALPAPGGEGLLHELEEALEALDPQAGSTLRDLTIVRVAVLVEHYELGLYDSLVGQAELRGADDVGELLGRSREDERAMLDEGLAIAARLARDLIRSPARA